MNPRQSGKRRRLRSSCLSSVALSGDTNVSRFGCSTSILLILIGLFTVISAPDGSPAAPLEFRDATSKINPHYRGIVGTKEPPLDPSFLDNEGVYLADVNNDYWTDVLLIGDTTPRLYRNSGGDFHEQTSFPSLRTKISAAVFVDFNTDGFRDLVFVPRKGPIILKENDAGSFRTTRRLNNIELTSGVGITTGDFDGNRCPDIFVIQFGDRVHLTPTLLKKHRGLSGYRRYSGDNGDRNYLLMGNCSGGFERAADDGFFRTHWSLATSALDLDGNGLMDIHVANDFYQDSLYLNRGDSGFEHRYLGKRTARNGMSSEITDFNQDGRPDIYVSNIFLPEKSRIFNRKYFQSIIVNPKGHNALVNQGGAAFTDRARELNLQGSGWGWAVSTGDFDNDFSVELIQGLQDLLAVPSVIIKFFSNEKPVIRFMKKYFGNQQIYPYTRLNNPLYEDFKPWLGYPNLRNRDGVKSTSFSLRSGPTTGFGRLNARGLGAFDYDRDGDPDLLISQYAGPFKLFENVTNEQKDNSVTWVKISVRHPEFGGRISMRLNQRTKYFHITSRTDFVSQEPAVYTVGLDGNEVLDELTVKRPGLEPTTRRNVAAGSRVVVSGRDVVIRSNVSPQ